MRFRFFCLTVACALGAILYLPLSASAEPRMLVGFQDDPSLRWRDDRTSVFDVAEAGTRRHRPDDRLLVADRGEAPRKRAPTRSTRPTGSTTSTSSSATQACTGWKSC